LDTADADLSASEEESDTDSDVSAGGEDSSDPEDTEGAEFYVD
jgi:hypothetical protein